MKKKRQIANCHIFVLPSRLDCNVLAVREALETGWDIYISEGVGKCPAVDITNGFDFEIDDEQSILNSIFVSVISQMTSYLKWD